MSHGSKYQYFTSSCAGTFHYLDLLRVTCSPVMGTWAVSIQGPAINNAAQDLPITSFVWTCHSIYLGIYMRMERWSDGSSVLQVATLLTFLNQKHRMIQLLQILSSNCQFPFLSLNSIILLGAMWDFVILICTSLVTSFYVFSDHVYAFLGELSIQILYPF